MKKVGLFLMLAVFTLSTSSFKKSENHSNLEYQEDFGINCQEYAASRWLLAKSYGYQGEALNNVFTKHFFRCSQDMMQ